MPEETSANEKLASMVLEETDSHIVKVVRVIFTTALITAVLTLLVNLLALYVQATLGGPSPRWSAEPVSGGTVMAMFGILAAAVLSVRVAVTPVSLSRGGRGKARRVAQNEFMANLAGMTLFGILLVGGYSLMWFSPPDRPDLIRLAAIIGTTGVLACAAADTVVVAQRGSPRV